MEPQFSSQVVSVQFRGTWYVFNFNRRQISIT